MLRRALVVCALAASVATSPLTAMAAPGAKQAEKEGQQAEKKGKWEDARNAYEKALELDDRPDTRLRLAGVEEKLGHLVEAANHLKKALESGKLSFAQRARAKNQLKSLEKRTPTLTFDVPRDFNGSVTLDDRKLSSAELGAPVPANPGKHQVRAEAEGMKPYVESVELAEKDRKTLSILLEPLKEETPAAASEDEDVPRKARGGSRTLAYVALGVGVVGVGVGAFMGLQAKSTKDELDGKCKSGVCTESERDLYDRGKTQANVSTAGFIVGAVGIGVGTVLLLTGGKGEMEGKASARRATPYVGPGAIGVRGRF